MGWLELLTAAFLITLPFGAWRATTRRLSLRWFLAIHVPIPIILLIRIESGYSWHYIPFTLGGCLLGQVLGARFFSAWRNARQARHLRPAAASGSPRPLSRPDGVEHRRSGTG